MVIQWNHTPTYHGTSTLVWTQVEQAVHIKGKSKAVHPSSKHVHVCPWEAPCGNIERNIQLLWLRRTTEHSWGGNAVTSGHLRGFSTTTPVHFVCHFTGTACVFSLHLTISVCSYAAWNLTAGGFTCDLYDYVLQPLITFSLHGVRPRHPVKLFLTPITEGLQGEKTVVCSLPPPPNFLKDNMIHHGQDKTKERDAIKSYSLHLFNEVYLKEHLFFNSLFFNSPVPDLLSPKSPEKKKS